MKVIAKASSSLIHSHPFKTMQANKGEKTMNISKEFPAGTELFRQGAAAQTVYLIERGIVKLLHSEEDGRELMIGLRYPGWFLGAAPAISQRTYEMTALTLTQCRMRCFSTAIFLNLIKTDADFSWDIQQHLTRGMRQYINRLTDMGSLPARQHLEKLLRDVSAAMLSSESKETARLRLPLKQWEMAQLLAITPQYLNLLLKDLESEGLISRERGRVIVSDLKRFSAHDDSE